MHTNIHTYIHTHTHTHTHTPTPTCPSQVELSETPPKSSPLVATPWMSICSSSVSNLGFTHGHYIKIQRGCSSNKSPRPQEWAQQPQHPGALRSLEHVKDGRLNHQAIQENTAIHQLSHQTYPSPISLWSFPIHMFFQIRTRWIWVTSQPTNHGILAQPSL